MKNPSGLLALSTALALMAAACGGSTTNTEGAASEASEDVTTSETPLVTLGSGSEGDGPAETTSIDTEGEGASDGTCLVGDWVIDQGEMQGFYNAMAANAGGMEMSFTIDGSTGMSFGADGRFLYTPQFALSLDTGGISGEGEASGQLTGSYSVADGIISTEVENSDLALEITVAGVTVNQDTLGDLFSSVPVNSAPFTCGEEGPIIQFTSGVGTTHPVQLKAS